MTTLWQILKKLRELAALVKVGGNEVRLPTGLVVKRNGLVWDIYLEARLRRQVDVAGPKDDGMFD